MQKKDMKNDLSKDPSKQAMNGGWKGSKFSKMMERYGLWAVGSRGDRLSGSMDYPEFRELPQDFALSNLILRETDTSPYASCHPVDTKARYPFRRQHVECPKNSPKTPEANVQDTSAVSSFIRFLPDVT
ncbi:hypothetical protein N7492_010449 [Penicillium capsulatum]|uniref:Uncharacterized protein n=1 Tax=Penicillium capsulatum TaxID=69766 RepID=A0A9W9LEY0_9EURO|nr:hypothetical protein N7492_010449 [Penicillium capsulatum]KAJ6112952.1 hypothetical protein N7512_008276 [Penicillium capsulatum]